MAGKVTKENKIDPSLMMNPDDFNYEDYPFTYMIKKDSGEIRLMKTGKELPLEVREYFNNQSNAITPPWVPNELEYLIRYNHTHRRCMELKATLIAGFGYDFRNKKHRNYKKLEKFMKRPNEEFGNTGSKIMIDLQRQKGIYGYGPVIINKAWDVIQMFAATNTKSTFIIPKMRNGVRATGVQKYVQVSSEQGFNPVEFYPYDGFPQPGKSYMYWIGHKKISSSYYPEPVYLSAKDKIYEDIYVDKNNIDFFMNRAMGDFVILFSGAKLNTKTKDKVQADYKKDFANVKGIGNQHKTMVLHSPGKDAKIQIVDLSKNEDGQYSVRQANLESAIARAWGITPALISLVKGGSGFGGGGVAIADLFLENQIMIRPEQHDFEEDMNLIFESLFGFNPDIKFRTIDTNNQKDMAVILNQIISSGTPIAKKEARMYVHEHGLMELEDPETIPDDEDRVVPNTRTQTNIDGDNRPDGNTDVNADDITTIDENKNEN